jgi:hypothetical protein
MFLHLFNKVSARACHHFQSLIALPQRQLKSSGGAIFVHAEMSSPGKKNP